MSLLAPSSSKEEQLAVWSVLAGIIPRLCGDAHLQDFENAQVGPQSFPQQPLQHSFARNHLEE